MTSTCPLAPAGVFSVRVYELTTVTLPAVIVLFPKLTLVLPVAKFVPVKVTGVLPSRGPCGGDMSVKVGGSVGSVGWLGLEGVGIEGWG